MKPVKITDFIKNERVKKKKQKEKAKKEQEKFREIHLQA